MKAKQPQLYLSGCPCHLIHRAALKAATEIKFNVDEVLVDTYCYLQNSSKRLAALERFQDEVKHQKIHKHVATRWLSVRSCLERILENWNALQEFFKEESGRSASTSNAHARLDRLKTFSRSPTNRLYCLFLVHALEPFDTLNKQLQSEAPQIHTLMRSLHGFMRKLLVRFVKPVILAEKKREKGEGGKPLERSKTVLEINYKNPSNHKSTVLLSGEADRFLTDPSSHLREEKVKEFHANTKKFYVAGCTYIKEKFPMQEVLLQNAEICDPERRLEVTEDQLMYFLKRFPCLLQSSSIDDVKTEFVEYQSHELVPGLIKERVDATWVALGQVKDGTGTPLFANLTKIMLGILLIPHSNAACERIFSCVTKNKTNQRASLSAETVDSLLVVKSRPGEPHERNYSSVQLTKLKSSYYNLLSKKPD
ncbi:hypothetical protein V1264_024416 [Littorina saxatilis]|uniref:HAT C-terminal dimerisation domain-containing protein n=1 Tax=Littorina saxatilis TaxID=31220 RepID=A0AAN9FZ15_9CAEN